MICFLDLDGVLVDFIKGAHEFHKMPYSMKDYPYKLGNWDNCPPYNSEIVTGEFWNAFDEDFWADLDWMEDGRMMLNAVEKTFDQKDICILSVPTLCPRSASGKIKWIQKHLPQYSRQFLIGPPKSFCAHSRAVLIDDRDKNVEYFTMYGGYSILVPRPWNSLYNAHHKSSDIVRNELKELKESGVWKD